MKVLGSENIASWCSHQCNVLLFGSCFSNSTLVEGPLPVNNMARMVSCCFDPVDSAVQMAQTRQRRHGGLAGEMF